MRQGPNSNGECTRPLIDETAETDEQAEERFILNTSFRSIRSLVLTTSSLIDQMFILVDVSRFRIWLQKGYVFCFENVNMKKREDTKMWYQIVFFIGT
jgi:hypothetical protein